MLKGRKTIDQSTSSFIAIARNDLYAFYTEKGSFLEEKKSETIGGGSSIAPPLPLNPFHLFFADSERSAADTCRCVVHSTSHDPGSHAEDPSASGHLGRHGWRSAGAILPTDSARPQHLSRQKPCVAIGDVPDS